LAAEAMQQASLTAKSIPRDIGLSVLESNSSLRDLLSDPLLRFIDWGSVERNRRGEHDLYLLKRGQLLDLGDGLSAPALFEDFVSRLHSQTGVKISGFRTCHVRIKSLVFGGPRGIPDGLERLRSVLKESYDQRELFGAAIALQGINQIHPFEDGNGRTARTLMNLMATHCLGAEFVLPLEDADSIVPGALGIKLNRAHFEQDYIPLVRYMRGSLLLLGAARTHGPSSRARPERVSR
jgi:hypothetical protein